MGRQCLLAHFVEPFQTKPSQPPSRVPESSPVTRAGLCSRYPSRPVSPFEPSNQPPHGFLFFFLTLTRGAHMSVSPVRLTGGPH